MESVLRCKWCGGKFSFDSPDIDWKAGDDETGCRYYAPYHYDCWDEAWRVYLMKQQLEEEEE